jgi:MSHA biogenesis protein MshI
MIRQQINLYQERFREPKVVLSSLQSLALLGLVLALMLGGSYQYASAFNEQQRINQQRVQEKQHVEQQLAANRKRLDAELADTRIDEQLRELLRDIDSRKRLVRFVDNNSLGSGVGFSAQLVELSELGINEVWLNEISLKGEFIRLSGSALKAEDIPLYFHQFKRRNLFKGRVFDMFELKRDKQQDWKVDFVIASRSSSDEG